ncbi:short-chain dehydrogenase [Oceanobacillus sp. J11TS1]|uniref:short-chain dehydrogenase n=1 Tax=Oceanobacillus sp. J11TS1 TaxID=2807191 RepID=UPI001B0334D4|nr:short-chain dehydrogenase [Oceanobacillus sp. J11TS1]GIO23740.1 hypothetical protein J11TS1_23210 [Oceanobacillus sp. J11TS1]
MKNDHWEPLSVEEIKHLLKDMSISWWIAGGWALDLYYGKQTRKHDDMDILIKRSDLPILKKHLNENYELFLASSGTLSKLTNLENLSSQANSLWVRKKNGSSWLFEIMLMDTENDEWIYKRDKHIKRPLEDIGAITEDGTPYVRPEIQLLYKGGSSVIREKDGNDLLRMLPILKKAEVHWLHYALGHQFNGKHPWLEVIADRINDFPAHALVVGGTGMLSGVSLWLAGEATKVSVIARSQGKMKELLVKAHQDACIIPLLVDYKDSTALKEKIRACISQNGPIDLVVAWIHSDGKNALDIISNEVAQTSPFWKLYHVLGSSANIAQIKEVAVKKHPNCQYRQIQLGFIWEKSYSRWLTHQEISKGIIDAIIRNQEVKVIGTLEPWNRHP